LLAIVRRFDTDGDAKINFNEFSDVVKSQFPPIRPSRLEIEEKERFLRS